MAVPVDSFHLLWKEISSTCKECLYYNKRSLSWKDILILLGGIYAAKKTLGLARVAYKQIRVYGFGRVVRGDPVKLYGKWAVITGCTGGIGEAFVNQLAARGHDMVLISRGSDALSQLAQSLEETFGVQTVIVPVDFNEGKAVYTGIKEALADKDVGILVNNVGVMYDYPQMFLDVPEEKLWQLVNVNVAAATMLTNIVLPGMVERGRGAVVTVSSGSSFMPTPQMTVYSATKAYLDVFIRALSYEYKDSGVTFQVLLPFYVATRMTQYSATLSNPSLFIPSATNYARSALSTLGWTDRTTGYWPHTVQAILMWFIPESVWMWGSMRLNDALRRQAFTRMERRASLRRSKQILQSTMPQVDTK